MLNVENLTKRYGKVVANDGLSFRAPAGEITVLLGPNGAGKSTAIKAIAGLLRFSGNITIGGHPNKSMEAKRLLGYVAESPGVYDMLTVPEHFEFIARAYDLPEDYKAYQAQLMDRMELHEHAKKLGRELSKGMQQKLSLCLALLTRPGLLLVDEPMVGLDPYAIKELKQMLAEERGRGTAVLVCTHLIDSVEELWDRALILMRGKFEAERTRAEIAGSGESLEDLFFALTAKGHAPKEAQA